MKIKHFKYNSRQFFSIVDEMDCPIDPYISTYINTILISKAPNTIRRYVNELIFVISFFNDLPSRFASQRLLSNEEYNAFFRHCYYPINGRKGVDIASFSIENKAIRNIIAANSRIHSQVRPETIQGRLRRLREYSEWLFNLFHHDYLVGEQLQNKFDTLISRMKLCEEGFGKNFSLAVKRINESVIPNDKFLELLEMILPSSSKNPFKSSKIRNYLIVSLLIQSGIRRGALAKLKISDCHFYGTFDEIEIYRSGYDKTDTRSYMPNQKTKSHLAVVDPELLKQIKFYINHSRLNFERSSYHDFIFVSEKNSRNTSGNPLSLKSVNAIFLRLSKALSFRIHPHMLRHKWNEIFDEKGRSSGMDSRLIEDVRKYAMGWSANSSMGQVYNEKRLFEQVREVSKAHQERVNKQ